MSESRLTLEGQRWIRHLAVGKSRQKKKISKETKPSEGGDPARRQNEERAVKSFRGEKQKKNGESLRCRNPIRGRFRNRRARTTSEPLVEGGNKGERSRDRWTGAYQTKRGTGMRGGEDRVPKARSRKANQEQKKSATHDEKERFWSSHS